ncbi:AraC family transcriptional regulator [Cupriavidus plantarum]|uniref:AraC family transcriptional regulator n=1 Tax=Cupriavidus plantarum TaxID=942865 RepID=A0A316EUR4_9BURK|nr:AraC family transcriptional regulator [Cupriavidus plantarum]
MQPIYCCSESRCLHYHSIGASCTADRTLNSVQWISCVIPADRTTAHASAAGHSERSARRISVSAPFIAIVPAWAHIETAHDDDPRGLVLAFDSVRLSETARHSFGSEPCDIPRWITAWDPFLRQAAETLSAVYAGIGPAPDCLAAFADVLALHLAGRYGRARTREAGARLSQTKLAVVDDFIHLHIAEYITVERLAALLHMSTSHFAHAFKNATGLTPHFYVTTKRLRYAECMLIEGSMPLIDVGARAGFQTQQHFTAVFHQFAGCTPRAFRLAHARLDARNPP